MFDFHLLANLSMFCYFVGDLNTDIMTKAETEREKQRLRDLLGSNKALEASDFFLLLSLISLHPSRTGERCNKLPKLD